MFLSSMIRRPPLSTLSLHDALPISVLNRLIIWLPPGVLFAIPFVLAWLLSDVGTEGRSPITFFKSLIFYHLRSLKRDRKSTRLNSSHVAISYAVFCLKKKICISFLF